MEAAVGDTVLIAQPYFEFPEGSGYLRMQQGQQVLVAHVGTGENADWYYGRFADNPGIEGWFPKHIVVQQARPAKAPPAKGPPVALHQPSAHVPAQVQQHMGHYQLPQQQPQSPPSAFAHDQQQLYQQQQQPLPTPAAGAPHPSNSSPPPQQHYQNYQQQQYQPPYPQQYQQQHHQQQYQEQYQQQQQQPQQYQQQPPQPPQQYQQQPPQPPQQYQQQPLQPPQQQQQAPDPYAPTIDLDLGDQALPTDAAALHAENMAAAEAHPDVDAEGGFELPLPGFDEPFESRIPDQLRDGIAGGSNLPLHPMEARVRELVLKHRLTIIDAATGSGKSTMVPLYLADQCASMNRSCRIVVTQPRRLAARSLATRVAKQTCTYLGELVGFRSGAARADNNASIVYVTSGHLLAALVHNPDYVKRYSHIILDEVHERVVEADFLMAMLRLLLSRPEHLNVRIVVMSATLQKTFGDFFRPLVLPYPHLLKPGHVSLPGKMPFEIKEYLWEDIVAEFPSLLSSAGRTPKFDDIRPNKMKDLPVKRRSDLLTQFCNDVSNQAAATLLRFSQEVNFRDGYVVALVFLPGLDQMRTLEKNINDQLRQYWFKYPDIYLIHSSFEPDTYEAALHRESPGEFRIVLSTNMAESSITVPGVNLVLDLGLHRVNVYEDKTRMAALCTEWCCKASMKQRRGRTGRTCPGIYIRLLPESLLDELPEFDESQAKRSPLMGITLKAAHVAETLSNPPRVQAGLPVIVKGEGGGEGTVDFWEQAGCPEGKWRVIMKREGDRRAFPLSLSESRLKATKVAAVDVLNLLPNPPNRDRIDMALLQLHELGTLTSQSTPSIVGVACLKLPLEVEIARFVVISQLVGYGPEACILAAAMSICPSCDVMKSPYNTRSEYSVDELNTFAQATMHRARFDAGFYSEPLAIFLLCIDWLREKRSSCYWNKIPTTDWGRYVHTRIWPQFTESIVDIAMKLSKLVISDEQSRLDDLIWAINGDRIFEVPTDDASLERLVALMTWALAPTGYIALGQTPSLYIEDESLTFMKEVHAEDPEKRPISNMLWWPKKSEQEVRIAAAALQCQVFTAANADGCVSVVPPQSTEVMQLSKLHRVCGPFNQKKTTIWWGSHSAEVPAPQHPCSLKWYMPSFSTGGRMEEVVVSWKSQAASLLHIPDGRDKLANCRPKSILVACGGSNHYGGGNRHVQLRGVTLLPMQDGGRSALMWLLAAGAPLQGRVLAFAAPTYHEGQQADPETFEIRALRIWQQTISLGLNNPITSRDLSIVNDFREAIAELHRRKPHRLAGLWETSAETTTCMFLECIDKPEETERQDQPSNGSLATADATQGATQGAAAAPPVLERLSVAWASDERNIGEIRSVPGSRHWKVYRDDYPELVCGEGVENEEGTEIVWGNGDVWTLKVQPVLSQIGNTTVKRLKRRSRKLLQATIQSGNATPAPKMARDGGGESLVDTSVERWQWPGRLVCLQVPHARAEGTSRNGVLDVTWAYASSHLGPFQMEKPLRYMEEMARACRHEHIQAADLVSRHPLARPFLGDSEAFLKLQLKQNEDSKVEMTWIDLANNPYCSPEDEPYMPESAIGLPKQLTCAACGQAGQSFSKNQLLRAPWERRCLECVAANRFPEGVQGNGASSSTAAARAAASAAAVAAAVPAAPEYVKVCSVCQVPINKDNCSQRQLKEAVAIRKCMACVQNALKAPAESAAPP